MSIVSTLEQARDFLALPAEAPAGEVLDAARARQAQYIADGENPRLPAVRRNGVKRQLALLVPMLPLLEIEAELAVLETSAASPGSRIHQLRLECSKLGERVAALPAGDERTILEARLKEVDGALNPAKKNREVEIVLAALETAAASPGSRVPQLRLECNAIAIRIASLPAGDEQRAFEARLKKVSDGLNARIELGEIETALGRLETSASTATAKTDPLVSECEQLGLRLTALPPGAERAALEARLKKIAENLNTRRQFAEIETTLGVFETSAAAPEARIDALLAEIDPLARRVAALPAGVIRNGFDARLKKISEALAARRQFGEMEAALARLEAGASSAPRPNILIGEVTQLAGRIAALPAHPEKSGLDARAKKLSELLAARKQFMEFELTLARLETAIATPGAKTTPLKGELDQLTKTAAGLPDGTERSALETRLKAAAEKLSAAVAAKKAAVPPTQTGEVLKLVPLGGGRNQRPIHFVARPRFVVGRFSTNGPSLADFSCPLAEKRVGRVHVTLVRKGNKIMVQDGDGTRKSTNGSKLEGEPITAEVTTNFLKEKTLLLGEAFTVAIQHLPGEAPAGPTFTETKAAQDTGSKTVVINVLSGSLRFQARPDNGIPASVTWIFTDASLGSSPSNAVPLTGHGVAETAARVHFWQNAFWIENLTPDQNLRLTEKYPSQPAAGTSGVERPLMKGEVSPLRSGDILRLGQMSYEVVIES